ncbi:MAG: histidine kinase, partial [Nitrospinota bacterium]|nr:histidine kinase [Nitrospinota bacterium]MDH5678829.1 histidine kinase [Nitrospinota bacterium]
LVVASVLVALAGMGAVSHFAVRQSIEASLQGRLALAQVIAGSIDYALRKDIAMLEGIPPDRFFDMLPEAPGAVAMLEGIHRLSIFSGGVMVADLKGKVAAEYPHGASGGVDLATIPGARVAFQGRGSFITSLHAIDGGEGESVFALVPLRKPDGVVAAVAVGRMDPALGLFAGALKPASGMAGARIEIIDQSGVIIYSSQPERVLAHGDHNRYIATLIATGKPAVEQCHNCHAQKGVDEDRSDEILVFTPLSAAPWGIAVIEPKDAVYAPSTGMREAFSAMGLIIVATSALLALGLSASIVAPIDALMKATRRLAREELSEPITLDRADEIGALAQSFEAMRGKLAGAMENVRRYGVDLEQRVMDRTRELDAQRRRLAKTLDQVIRAQEEERMRIARELHDETSQAITALGMSLEVAAMELRKKKLTESALLENRHKANRLLEGIRRIIRDLRPPALDDLGLESSIRWLLASHLEERGIQYSLQARRRIPVMDKGMELRLFRVVQEAVINIARHSHARNVAVALRGEEDALVIQVNDDGEGFDREEVLRTIDLGEESGFGLVGMKERVAQVCGTLEIDTAPGRGTRITVTIPIRKEGGCDEPDSRFDS